MSVNHGRKLVLVNFDDGATVTYVVRESEASIEITAASDPRISQAAPIRELVALLSAILPNGIEKFYAFKLLRLVEENIDHIEDRMTAQQKSDLDELPF